MRKAIRIVFIIVIVAAMVSSVRYCASPYSTETVTYYEYEKSISGMGYILRDETIVTNAVYGVFEAYVNDGERVKKGARVGTVISGQPDEAMLEELSTLNGRIEDIEKSNIVANLYHSDTRRIASAVTDSVESLREAVRGGDYSKASELKKEIGYLKTRSSELEESEARETLLSQLYERKAEIENSIGTAQTEIYAPVAGIYSAAVDGLEKYGSPERLSTLLPSDIESFDEILEEYEPSAGEACKITDSFSWYLTAVVSDEEAKDISVGDSVSVLIDTAEAAEVDATVRYISEAEDGKRAIAVESNLYVEGITGLRSVDYKLVLLRKSGLKIPSAALRIEGDKKGVYILLDKKKSFRYVNDNPFRSEDDSFYIVDAKYTPPGAAADYVPLKEYDKVLLKPEEVK